MLLAISRAAARVVRARAVVAAIVLSVAAATAQAADLRIDTLVADIDAQSLATNAAGDLYVATPGRISRVGADGSLTAVVGDGTPGYAGDGGPALAARIGRVPAMTFLANGDLAFADADANRIRVVAAGNVATIAGNGSAVHSGDGGPALAAGLGSPTGLVQGDGRLYVSVGHRIRRIDDGTITTWINASGVAGINSPDQPHADVLLDSPNALAFKDNTLYFADAGNRRIFATMEASSWPTVVLNNQWMPGDYAANSLAIDAEYALLFTQAGKHWVLRNPGGLQNDPYAGTRNTAGFAGDGGPLADALLSSPSAVAVHADVVYVADTGNRRIRRIAPIPLPVPPAPLASPWYSAARVTVVPWQHPEGTVPVSYEVSYDPTQGWGFYTMPLDDAEDREYGGLTVGQSYSFHVRAVYADDRRGPWSPPSPAVVPVLDQIPKIDDASVLEGDTGTRPMQFTLWLSEPAMMDVDYSFGATVSSTAAADDFTETIVQGVIPKGQSSVIVSVPVHGDALVEGNEEFLVSIGHRGFAAGNAKGTIVDDDGTADAFGATDDRFYALDGGDPVVLDVLGNDVFAAGALDGGSLELVTSPAHGTLAAVAGSGGTAADDRYTYTPARGFAGEDVFIYRLCPDDGACWVARATVRVGLIGRHDGNGGHAGATVGFDEAARPLAGLRFEATPLRSLASTALTLSGDPTPQTPWDAGGNAYRTYSLPASATAVRWRLYASTDTLLDHDVTLYVGVDLDGDGAPDAGESRCTFEATALADYCDLDVDVAANTSARWWVLAQNRSVNASTFALLAGASPLVAADGSLVAAGPGTVADGAAFRTYATYDDPTLIVGEHRVGFARVFAGDTLLDTVPVTVEHGPQASPDPLPLRAGVDQVLRLAAGAMQDRLFVDVPAGASALTVTVDSDRAVELYLAPDPTPDAHRVAAAPSIFQATASGSAANGEVSVTVAGGQLTAGRWYVTPRNAGATTAAMVVNASITGVAPVVRPGSYFNAARSGHGVFLYPAGDQLAGLWYTYRDGGQPVWYYLQGAAPGANGVWSSDVYFSSWLGSGNRLVPIGRATFTPSGADAFQFSYQVLGSVGAEPMAALGRGCPALGGQPVDASSHWFDPATAGTGYSTQLWPEYEYYAAFVYDAQGVARFLTAERNGFGGGDATLDLEQLTGFCPTCVRNGAPTRQSIGTLRRTIADGSLQRLVVAAAYANGIPGAWTGDDDVQPLGGAGTTQGCEP